MTGITETKYHPPVINSKPWGKNIAPKRILAIRLQAFGDVVITLPYLQQLKKTLPSFTKFDLLTLEENAGIPKAIKLFDHVHTIGGKRNYKMQLLLASLLLPKLLLHHYDVVIDLQNNIISRFIRKSLWPNAWSSFDRFSTIPAGERTRLTIEAVGLGKNFADTNFGVKDILQSEDILKNYGWDSKKNLIVLNPAGAFETRNWPLSYYTSFAKLWLKKFPRSQFLIMGTNFILPKADELKTQLGNNLINIVGKTTAAEAFAIIQKVKLVLSEDSGLMHVAWVSGIPILALFGSTRSDWSRPLGEHTLLLHSSDLKCGNCMQEHCKYGDTHCLTRYTPEIVFEKALALIEQ